MHEDDDFRASATWRRHYDSLAHLGDEVARRNADFRVLYPILDDAMRHRETGVYADGLGGFVAVRDGRVHHPARATREAARADLAKEI